MDEFFIMVIGYRSVVIAVVDEFVISENADELGSVLNIRADNLIEERVFLILAVCREIARDYDRVKLIVFFAGGVFVGIPEKLAQADCRGLVGVAVEMDIARDRES